MKDRCNRPLPVWVLLCGVAALGCDERLPPPQKQQPAPVKTGSRFDPTTAGTITGRVTWAGPIPKVPPFEIRALIPPGDKEGQPRLIRENPNAPAVDPSSRGMAGAVVFLRGVAAEKARPWDLSPVRVEQRDRRLHVLQGDIHSRVGFVRVGDEVEMVSREARFHSLHAGGDAFFTLTFPDPDRPRRRRLTSCGLVELSSAANYYWMRGYLFVADHPYFARTDAQGRFRLERVPPGRYEVVCWHPSWVEQGHDRDPETSLVFRLRFRPPVERARPVELEPRAGAVAELSLSAADFAR
jgi:hypothetical protein